MVFIWKLGLLVFVVRLDVGVREGGGNFDFKIFVLSYCKNGVVIY